MVNMDTIALPFRIAGGELVKTREQSDEQYALLLTTIMLTEPGEFILNPNFGVDSPTFDSEQTENFVLQAAQYVPEISVRSAKPVVNDAGRVDIQVAFEQR